MIITNGNGDSKADDDVKMQKIEDSADNDKQEGDEIESTGQITFSPPLYKQRYVVVTSLIEDLIKSGDFGNKPKTIVEYGSAKCQLMMYLKTMAFVERISFIDLDKSVLQESTFNLKPLPYEYLVKRDSPLVVEQYAGCVTKCDSKFINMKPDIFAIVAIELIEHLDPDILAGFEKNVFGVLSPPVVVITTPDSNFNPVFGIKPGQFRHWDHRFEWSRAEFKVWCNKICDMYKYECKIDGVGHGPAGTELFGSPSQFAIFKRSILWSDQNQSQLQEKYPGIIYDNAYNLVSKTEYPFLADSRSIEEKIADEYKYYVNNSLLSLSKLQDLWLEDIATTTVSIQSFFDDIQYKLNKNIRHVPIELKEDQIYNVLRSVGHQIEVTNDESGIKKYTALINIPTELEYLGESDHQTSEEEDEENNVMNEMVSDIRLAAEEEEEW